MNTCIHGSGLAKSRRAWLGLEAFNVDVCVCLWAYGAVVSTWRNVGAAGATVQLKTSQIIVTLAHFITELHAN